MVILTYSYFLNPYAPELFRNSTQQLFWGIDGRVWFGANNIFYDRTDG